MIGYITLGTNDLKRGAAFYDTLLAELGAKRMMEHPGQFVAWTTAVDQPGLSLTVPFDGQPASVGNGVMVALQADSREQVDRVYAQAIDLGAEDEGKPGLREGIPGFYAGYFRDPDGNKLNVFHMATWEG
jgi:catechol 2,3-dioxygenase-like lactoylglutathione lyase family enzyme